MFVSNQLDDFEQKLIHQFRIIFYARDKNKTIKNTL